MKQIKVLVRGTQYNPRPFIVRDKKKIALWVMLAKKTPLERHTDEKGKNYGYGIRVVQIE